MKALREIVTPFLFWLVRFLQRFRHSATALEDQAYPPWLPAAQRRTALRLVREFPQLNNYSQKFVVGSSALTSPRAQPDVNNPQLNR
jgi:hypothetical protein